MLPVHQGRTLAFSFGSRNSFVVLPLALVLPEAFEIAVFVIVLQSLIELFGMAAYVWLILNVQFRHPGKGGGSTPADCETEKESAAMPGFVQ